MKKIDIWLVLAIALAVIVNPDESDTFLVLALWGHVVLILVLKALLQENEENPYDNEKGTTNRG